MAHPYHHAVSSSKKWGGTPEDYQDIHVWFDASKEFFAGPAHRALRHHTEGIFEAERVFGVARKISTGRVIPVRWVGEQHVREDLGFIPPLSQWLEAVEPQPWMQRRTHLESEVAA